MTVARSAGDVLSDHTVFEVECIDRMFLNVWVPRLAYGAGVQGFFVGHRGHHYASTALMDPMTKAFVADIHGFVAARGLELVSFGKERKDDVAQQFLARFTGPEGVLFVGRAQEKALVWRTQRRYNQAGEPYAWLVRSTAFINHFYFYCVDEDFGPFSRQVQHLLPLYRQAVHQRQRVGQTPGRQGRHRVRSARQRVRRGRRRRGGAGDLRQPGTRADRRAAAQVAGDPAQRVHRRRRGRRLPLRAVDPAGEELLADPDAGCAVCRRIFFEQVIRDNLDIGRPDHVGLIFNRRILHRPIVRHRAGSALG